MGARKYSATGANQKLILRGISSMNHQKGFIRITSKDGSYVINKLFPIHKTKDYTGNIEIEGLPLGSEFNYVAGIVSGDKQLSDLKGKALKGGIRGTLRTREKGHAKTMFSFGSCRHLGKHDDDAFKQIAKNYYQDDFMIMCGDQIYGDHQVDVSVPLIGYKVKNPDKEHFQKHYRKAFGKTWFKKVTSTMPTYMTFDDHEVENGWSGQDYKRHVKKKALLKNALSAYNIYQASHSNAENLNSANPKYYYQFSHGNCDFFVMDTRYEKDLQKGSMISLQQKTAIKNFLSKGQNRIKFLVSAVPMFPDAKGFIVINPQVVFDPHPEERWEGHPNDRNHILELIRKNTTSGQNPNVFILSGDVHCSQVSKLQHATDPQFVTYNITSSAFNWTIPGLNDGNFAKSKPLEGSNGKFIPKNLTGTVVNENNFCRIVVDDTHINVSFYKAKNGKEIKSKRVGIKLKDSEN